MPTTSSQAVFACHSEACRPPTAGGTGGSSPGRDTGRKIGGETVYEFNDDGQRGFTVRGKDGAMLRAVFSVKNPPFGDDPRSTIDDAVLDGIAHESLTGLKLAYDLAPTRITPGVVIGDFSGYSKVGRGLTYGFVCPEGDPKKMPIGRAKIGINVSESTYPYFINGRVPNNMMPAVATVPLATYATAHEFGHHRQFNGYDGSGHMRPLKELYTASREDPDLSSYGKTNYLEAGAETFASWAMRGGHAETPLEKRYAERLRWGQDSSTFSIELALVEDFSDVAIVLDTFEGPAYVFKNGLRVNVKV